MKLSNEQYKGLQPYEEHFRTAVNGRWARYPGVTALQYMHGVYVDVTKTRRAFNPSCSSCVVSLLQDVGRIYFADKAERTAVEESAADKTAEPVRMKQTGRTEKKSRSGKNTKTKKS